jgi:hypothetical protein
MKALTAFAGGLAGACLLTITHQIIKTVDENDAPRMDLLGMEVLSNLLHAVDTKVPPKDRLYKITMGGDIISNSLYYSLAGIGGKKRIIEKGAVLGLIAGIGAVVVPKQFKLHQEHSSRNNLTKVLSIAYYLLGGVTAGVVIKALSNSKIV